MELRTEKPDITAKNYLSVGPGEYPCGNNLYLIVTPSGGRRWAFRYQRNGIVRKMGLGSARSSIGRYLDFYNPASQHPSVYVVEGKRVC